MDRDNYQKDNSGAKKIEIPNFMNSRNDWDQVSNKIGNDVNDLEDEDAFFKEVNSSLARQISDELEERDTNRSGDIPKKPRFSKGLKIFIIVFSMFMILGGLLMFTSGGRKIILNIAGNYIYKHLDYDASNPNLATEGDSVNTVTKEEEKPMPEVVNILLLGVEEIGGASNTDVMVVASMNTKDKSMKLTSLMRDSYVQIPGYNDNKLNSVYAREGIGLLYDTIELNFGLELDGYALVNFSAFEQIVDLLGGVEITLTSGEANYLNTTNYISNPAYRNVVTGTQVVNGNQAVGYCRIRYVSTGTENNDFGRTQRHRAVLNAIFDKLKSKNVLELGLVMNDILLNVKVQTDITQSEFNEYLEEASSLNVNKLDQLRIPSDGSFENARVQIGSHTQEVLQPTDWDATREEIRQFIYGNKEGTVTEEDTGTVE